MIRYGATIVVMVWASLCSGCMTFDGPETFQQHIGERANVQLERLTAVSLNKLGLWVTKFVTKTRAELTHFSQFDIGIYEVRCPTEEDCPSLSLKTLALDDWQRIMHIRTGPRTAVAFTTQSNDTLSGLLLLILDHDELTILHVRGRVQSFLEEDENLTELLRAVRKTNRFLGNLVMIEDYMRRAADTHRAHEAAIHTAIDKAQWQSDAPTHEGSNTENEPSQPRQGNSVSKDKEGDSQ